MPTTIFTPVNPPASNTSGNAEYRVFCPVTGGNLGQLRVTFTFAAGASACVVSNASIGIGDVATPPDVTGITELVFSGAGAGSGGHGFTISSAGGSITSDWLTFSGGGSTTKFAVHMSFPTTSTLYSYNVSEGVGNDSYFYSAVIGDYNVNDVINANYTLQTQINVLVASIETQSSGATLMGAICL